MKKFFITFGSGQLEEFNINPQHTMLVIEAKDENSARSQVFNSKIGAKFCTSYLYSKAEFFKEHYAMIEITLKELLKRERMMK